MAAQPADGAHTASGEHLQLLDAAAALRRVATLATRGASPAETFSAVARELAQLLGADVTSLLRYEPDGTVTVVGWWSVPGMDVPVGTRLAVVDDDLAASVRRDDQPGWTSRFEGPPGSVGARFQRLGVRSGVGAPITRDGRLWGVAVAAAARPGRLPAGSEWEIAGLIALVVAATADLNRIAGEQAALRRVAMLVASSAAPAEVFSEVAAEIRELLGADVATIMRFEPDGTATALARVGTTGQPELLTGKRRLPEPAGPIQAVRRTGRPARIDDLGADVSEMADIIRREGLRSALASPIHVGGRLWGAIVASSRRGPFPAGAEQRMADFTELAATAIANAESRAELVASRARIVAAFDRARRNIERDLHDGVQQRLVSLSLTLRGAQRRVPAGQPELHGALAQTAEGLAEILTELQEISRGIHPAILSQGGLGPALRTLARRSAIPVELSGQATARLPEPVEVAAYYVVAEALANAAKHAHASVVYLDVGTRGGALHLRVRDDGIGGADPARGTGLIGLNDRVAALGGTMQVDSPAGQGTSLLVTLPIAAA